MDGVCYVVAVCLLRFVFCFCFVLFYNTETGDLSPFSDGEIWLWKDVSIPDIK